jgi:hypothetical protein
MLTPTKATKHPKPEPDDIDARPTQRRRTEDRSQNLTLYTIYRSIKEPGLGGDKTVINFRGAFHSLADANGAVSRDLITGFKFVEYMYSVNPENKQAQVDAISDKGQELRVFVQKQVTEVRIPRKLACTSGNESESGSGSMVYVVIKALGQHQIPTIHSVHSSVASANAAVINISQVPGLVALVQNDGIESFSLALRKAEGKENSELYSLTFRDTNSGKYLWNLVFVQKKKLVDGAKG